jgi:hypothetical protein
MRHQEPSQDWQLDVHRRILERDPIAFPQLCEQALPHLVRVLENEYPQVDSHLIASVIHDLLLSYDANPGIYDPSKAMLFAFLRMSARDDLKNALDKQMRRERHLVDLEQPGVELGELARYTEQEDFDLADWLKEFTDRSPEDVIADLLTHFNPVEQRALMLMMEGVRETAQYVDIMGITGLDEVSQAREVKRLKDRINKRIRRFRDRIRRDE